MRGPVVTVIAVDAGRQAPAVELWPVTTRLFGPPPQLNAPVKPAAVQAVLAFATVLPTRFGTVVQAGVGAGVGADVGAGVGIGVEAGVPVGLGERVGGGVGEGVRVSGGTLATGPRVATGAGDAAAAGVEEAPVVPVGTRDDVGDDSVPACAPASLDGETAPSTPPAGRVPPPSTRASNATARTSVPAATGARRSGRAAAAAAGRRTATLADTATEKGIAHIGQTPGASAQHQRHAYPWHEGQWHRPTLVPIADASTRRPQCWQRGSGGVPDARRAPETLALIGPSV